MVKKQFFYPDKISHWFDNNDYVSGNLYFEKVNPADGKIIGRVIRGNAVDVNRAVDLAHERFEIWSNISVIERADILRKAVLLMQQRKEEIAQIIHLETGKSVKDSLGEVSGAIELGFFMAGEGRRCYGQTTTSAVPNRTAMTIRQPVGVCALIVPFNTPIANVAWKAFPALLCGNTVVLKASKDTPYTPIWFAKILKESGLPGGVFNVIQGSGEDVGKALVENEKIDLISFTGSYETGQYILQTAGKRMAKISFELGGKNAFVVCDDADIEAAAEYAVLSAFSNAGQRCASGSRIIIFDKIYDEFKRIFLKKTNILKVGENNTDDLGPVINEKQLNKMLKALKKIKKQNILSGGGRMNDNAHKNGYYMSPTIIEDISNDDEISKEELFGPVTCLYKVKDFNEALKLVNDSPYGLTAAIHTNSIHRIQEFINKSRVGVVSVNGATYGSEPHMPFGGLKLSGNGFREPGTQALDVYSEWKTVYIKHEPGRV